MPGKAIRRQANGRGRDTVRRHSWASRATGRLYHVIVFPRAAREAERINARIELIDGAPAGQCGIESVRRCGPPNSYGSTGLLMACELSPPLFGSGEASARRGCVTEAQAVRRQFVCNYGRGAISPVMKRGFGDEDRSGGVRCTSTVAIGRAEGDRTRSKMSLGCAKGFESARVTFVGCRSR